MEPGSSDRIPGGEWTAQIKWDGVRVLVYRDENGVRLINRKRSERTLQYPELTGISSYCNARSVILDGEVIALGNDGKPSFYEVMKRDGIRRLERVNQVIKAVPVTYMIFDVLYLNGEWLNRHPFCGRAEILNRIIRPNGQVQLVSCHEDGQTLFDVIKQHGMEGIVMKKTDSFYYFGQQKDVWLKIKNYLDVTALIGGFTLSGDTVNAVLLGIHDDEGKLKYIGHTGTGKMSRQEWRWLTAILRPLVVDRQPFSTLPERRRSTYWVRPKVQVRVKFTGWTGKGTMRQPSIEGFINMLPAPAT